MAEAVFQAPKRRPRVYERFEAPLPVSLSAEDEQHIIFRAEIIADHVIVTDPAHILTLYQRGFFGKGVFSRSRPEHVISQRWEYSGDRCLPVISSSEYQQRLVWARAALLMQGLEEQSVSQALETLTKPVELDIEGQSSEDRGCSDRLDSASCERLGPTDAGGPRRQGNPLYDPLAAVRPGDEDLLMDTSQYVLLELSEDGHSESSTSTERSRLECRRNPFTLMEYLQLSYEEAFFLVYALGCLSVCHSGEALSVVQVWSLFRSLQPSFSSSYAAYHYYRSKGWVPKSGVKYGADFMLYRKGPPFYHASYSVVVDRCDASLRPFSWKSLAALSRTTGNVSKELMLCLVIPPADLTEHMLSSPECLKRFSLQEVIVSRWVSSRERTEQDEI